MIEFAYNDSNHSSIVIDPFEALYGRRCRSLIGWFELGESSLIGPKILYEVAEKVQLIRDKLKMDQSGKKYNAENQKRGLEFEVGDLAYLKISPMKGMMIFGKNQKLSPRYDGPYDILK